MKQGACVKLGDKYLAMVARSGSHSLFQRALERLVPDWAELPKLAPSGARYHPIHLLGPYTLFIDPTDISPVLPLAVMVRDPLERFRSALARTRNSVEEALALRYSDAHFQSLSDMGLIATDVTYFRFPDQIEECAAWLGLETPVPQENAEPDENKPTLTPAEELAVRTAYGDDIALWERLQA
ncbi:MAG: hypothetical protein EBQ89_01895 [Alphaproteobacteria bacterium]|nr:hypothetical protein [Alphaproteobacteria bacterium]